MSDFDNNSYPWNNGTGSDPQGGDAHKDDGSVSGETPDTSSGNTTASGSDPSGSPANSGYTAPQNSGYTAPQNGGYTAPQNGGYVPPQAPGGYPYANGGSYGERPRTYGYDPTPAPGKGGNGGKGSGSKGVKILLSVVAVIVVLCIVLAVVFGVYNKKGGSSSSGGTTSTTSGSGVTMKIDSSPNDSEVSTAAAGEKLTANQVYQKVKDSSVGVLEYVSNSLYGEGSGILMSESDGYTYVITCAHVIYESGATVMVELLDDTQYSAEIVGFDKKTDVGVLKIKATGLSCAEFGDSTSVKVGDTVYAIGNPGGTDFAGSFTDGIVSAIDRPVSSSSNSTGYTMECIQHNAAINPGNSGGALVNEYGQVIGINSQKIVADEYEGMGFAIPISVAKTIVDSLISSGYVANRPALGIQYSSVSNYPQYAMFVSIKGLPAGSIIVAKINDNSSLSGSKAQVGDIITKVNGQELTTTSVLLDAIENSSVGDTITLTLVHVDFNNNYSSSEYTVDAKLIEDTSSSSAAETTTASSYYNFGGFGETTTSSSYYNPFGN